MKWAFLTIFLLVGRFGLGQGELLERKVSCRLQDHSLAEALSILSRENDLPLSFSNSYLPASRRYSFHFREVQLATVLNLLLRDTDLTYTVAADYLVVRPREEKEDRLVPLLFTISGFVEDSLTGERLIGANLYLPELGRGTATNADGFFSITVPADSVRLDVSYVGYHAATLRLGVFRDTRLEVTLTQGEVLTMVEVRAPAPGGGKAEVLPREPGRSRLPAPVLERMPGLLGEADALHALEWLPGVQAGIGNLGNLTIRNGDNGHNLILLDGAQVYHPNHLLGLYSVFNGSAVKDVELIKGAMPARYGGRLSSVVAVNGREGDFNRFAGEASLGLIVTKLMVEGPIIPGKMSFLAAGRRSWWDGLFRPILNLVDDNLNTGYHFGDLNFKVKHKVSGRDDWNLSVYLGQDRFGLQDRSDSIGPVNTPEGFRLLLQREDQLKLLWANKAISLGWNRVWSDRLFSSSSLSYSDFRFRFDLRVDERNYAGDPEYFKGLRSLYASGIEDLTLRTDLDLNLAPELRLHFGGAATWHRYRPQAAGDSFLLLATDDGLGEPAEGGTEIRYDPLRLDVLETGAYAELRGRWRPLRWQLGLHLAGFYYDRVFVAPQPRVQLNYELGPNSELIGAFRLNEQYAHLVTNNAMSLPTDLWVPSTRRLRPQRSWQASLGWQRFWGEDVTLRLESYYHDLRRLTTFGTGRAYFTERNWQGQLIQGSGRNYGFEASLSKMGGRLQGIISYDLSWAWREFEELNRGEPFPFRQNRRHQFSTLLQYRISTKVRFSAGWTYGSGQYLTVPTRNAIVAYPFGAWLEEDFAFYGLNLTDEVNNYRAPDYHRLDINFDFLKQGKWYLRKWSLGLYNAYMRYNPTFIYNDFYADGRIEIVGITLFPLIPSVSYQLKF